MKTKIGFFLFLSIVLASCSSDNPAPENADFFPLTTGNSWTYEVIGQTSSFDNLSVGAEIIIQNKTYKKIEVTEFPAGFYATFLNQNGLRKENGKLLFAGNLNLNLGIDLPLSIALSNFVLVDAQADNTNELSSQSNSISQDFNGFPITIDYTIKSTALESLPSFTTSQNETYSNVKKVNFALNIKVVTVQTIPGTSITIPITLLNNQDVILATHYYAENIGMVYGNTVTSYTLAIDPSEFDLDIPQSGSQTQEEFLDSYNLN
jgi:hypothetical protein